MKRLLLGLVLAALLVGCASHQIKTRDDCLINMSKLDAATEQYALENNLKVGDQAEPEKLSPYLRGGVEAIKCPAGGVYTFGVVGSDPSCSIHGSLSHATK